MTSPPPFDRLAVTHGTYPKRRSGETAPGETAPGEAAPGGTG
ncbi:hypothetical protein ABZ799_04840 [Nocardiopsis dassonvillei]